MFHRDIRRLGIRDVADIGRLATGFQGVVTTLERAGFTEIERRANHQVIMRYVFDTN